MCVHKKNTCSVFLLFWVASNNNVQWFHWWKWEKFYSRFLSFRHCAYSIFCFVFLFLLFRFFITLHLGSPDVIRYVSFFVRLILFYQQQATDDDDDAGNDWHFFLFYTFVWSCVCLVFHIVSYIFFFCNIVRLVCALIYCFFCRLIYQEFRRQLLNAKNMFWHCVSLFCGYTVYI